MKKLCKFDKATLRRQVQYRNCVFKCKKCGMKSDCKKSLCKAKTI